MSRFALAIATACTLIAAVPAAAQSAPRSAVAAVPSSSICARKLTSAQCGRYQDRILLAAVQRAPSGTGATAVRDLGRRQLDALIESLG